jgi:hypothetical protein
MRSTQVFALLAAASLSTVAVQAAPISYVGGTYSQNFDGLSATGSATITGRGPHDVNGAYGSMTNTGMAGWTMSNPLSLGSTSTDTETRAQDGSLSGSAGRGVVSFGTTGSGERAIGTLATSNQINRFGVAFTNDSGLTYGEFTLAFTGEQWRHGDDATPGPNVLSYDYTITAAPGDNIDVGSFTPISTFASPVTTGTINIALDGNLPANQTPKSHTLTGLNWEPSSTLIIRWSGQDLSGQDDGLAIDNMSFSASVPEPTTAALVLLLGMVMSCLRRRR